MQASLLQPTALSTKCLAHIVIPMIHSPLSPLVLSSCILAPKFTLMNCPQCGSEQIQKNGHRRHGQNYRCKDCGRQFIETYLQKGYSDDTRQICLRMYRSGLKPGEIARLTGISRSTLYSWVRQEGWGLQRSANDPGSASFD